MSNSTIDTMVYFYDTSFDPSTPWVNLITEDDDDGDIHLQFRIQAYLQVGHIYILVVTTHRKSVLLGVSSSLPLVQARIGLVSIIPSTSRPITTCKLLFL